MEKPNTFIARWPKAQFIQSVENLAPYEPLLFNDDHAVPMHLIGSPFYMKVSESPVEIPGAMPVPILMWYCGCGNAAPFAQSEPQLAKFNQLADPVPSGIAQKRQFGRISLGLSIKRAMLAYEALSAGAKRFFAGPACPLRSFYP